ncbi:helix-turn-helix domain-containing protein [Virgibacillus sp. FSP13]
MNRFMTIQSFSIKTGIPKSTLRYYEEKGLLQPLERSENGYRVYSDEQVTTAKLISSLRLADVPIKEIQRYLNADKIDQEEMTHNWIDLIKQRIDHLCVGLQYLGSDYRRENVYLLEKDSERIVWFAAESTPGNFEGYFRYWKERLDQHEIPIKNAYFKYLSGRGLIKAQIGFGIPNQAELQGFSGIDEIEHMNSCICIAIPYNDRFINIESGYRNMIHYMWEHNWIPAGPIFEWYRGNQYEEMDLVMPVTKNGGDKE